MSTASLTFPVFNIKLFFIRHAYAHSYPNRGSKWTHNLPKNGHIMIKTAFFNLNFQDEGHLKINPLIYHLSNYNESLLFLLFSPVIGMHLVILAWVQSRHISHQKKELYFAQKCTFEAYFLSWISLIY